MLLKLLGLDHALRPEWRPLVSVTGRSRLLFALFLHLHPHFLHFLRLHTLQWIFLCGNESQFLISYRQLEVRGAWVIEGWQRTNYITVAAASKFSFVFFFSYLITLTRFEIEFHNFWFRREKQFQIFCIYIINLTQKYYVILFLLIILITCDVSSHIWGLKLSNFENVIDSHNLK